MPACFGASGSVRARQRPQSAVCADDVHTFWPSMHPLVAVAHGARAQRREVGARSGFAEELAPRLVAAEHRLEEALLLLGGAVGHEGGTGHVDAHHEEVGVDVEVPLLLGRHARLDAGASLPAVLDRPVRRRPAGLELGALPRARLVELRGVVLRRLGPERLPPAVALAASLGHRLEPRPRLRADGGLGGGVVDVHVVDIRGCESSGGVAIRTWRARPGGTVRSNPWTCL